MKNLITAVALGLVVCGTANAQQVIAKGSWEAVAADGSALGSYKTSEACVAAIRSTLHEALADDAVVKARVLSAPTDNITDAQVEDSRNLVYLDGVVEAYASANCVQQ